MELYSLTWDLSVLLAAPLNGYKKEFEDYKEKMENKTTYYEKRNNIRDWIFFVSIFAMPVYVIIEIYLKFFAK
jgi:hypothetical protein